LAPIVEAWRNFSNTGFSQVLWTKKQNNLLRRRSACNPMSLCIERILPFCNAQRSEQRRNYGGHLGGREIAAGAAYAHANLAMEEMEKEDSKLSQERAKILETRLIIKK